MTKYLTQDQITSSLRLGKAIEQFISFTQKDDCGVIKWLRIEVEKNEEISVVCFESIDEGNEGFLDIYEFPQADPDEPYGLIDSFDMIEDALSFAIEQYDADLNKFVMGGMI